MPQTHEHRRDAEPKPLVISRTFPAPRDLVFEAWSTAEHMKRWFSPESFTTPHAEVDFQPGGVCDICMRAPNGQEFWSRGRYVEIASPEQLVFTSMVGDPDSPAFTMHTTATFEDHADGTRMTVHQAYDIHDEAFRSAVDGAAEGWRTTLDKLEKEVARLQASASSAAL